MHTIIKAEKLTKVYETAAEKITALKAIDFSVTEGEFITIMGPSGAGKTTLLNLIGCLDNITSGTLNVIGRNLAQTPDSKMHAIRRETVGFVFQEFFLIPTLTATENVELPSLFKKNGGKINTKERAVELLKTVDLKHRLNHFPSELSGGEMQRVAVARSLMNNPKIVLADEPTGNLDTRNSQNIFTLMREITRSQGVTVLLATHNVRLGNQADRVIHLHDGNIEKIEKGGTCN